MSVSVHANDLTRMRDLIALYIKKGSFEPEEIVDVGSVHKSVSEAIKGLEGASCANVLKKDVTFVLNAMSVCAQRSPIELQNYKPIYTLFETLSELLKESDVEEVESKA